MLIIPAIDLKDHQVVRLSQGKMGEAKIYSDNAVLMAEEWVKQGAKRLHCVDLNGAFEGKPIHFKEVKEIAEAFPEIKIEVGGGIRNLEALKRYFDCGVSHCIVGTAALKNPELLDEACEKFPKKIILGIDAKNGFVAAEGWGETSRISALDLAKKFKDKKISEVIYTDISKDGMMGGMNFEAIRQMAESAPFPIIASGGLTSLGDIKELKKIKNVSGVIAGKALYEGTIDLREAISVASR